MSTSELSQQLATQKQEAMSNENRWFCGEHFKQEVTDEAKLMEYYIKHGGAENFRKKCSDQKR